MLLPAVVSAEIVLSEILANEPGDTLELEWIELYNSGDDTLSLGLYKVIACGDTIDLPQSNINPQAYLVIVRKLTSENGRPSFESRWGDGSGYWGDVPEEYYWAIESEFVLTNNSGSVTIVDSSGAELDCFEWFAASPDGISVERTSIDPPDTVWHLSSDPSGGTPGRLNSPVELPVDRDVEFSIEPRIIHLSRQEWFRITISSPVGDHGLVEAFDDTGRRVLVLFDAMTGDGELVLWNGWDRELGKMAPGIYIIRATISGSAEVAKAIPVVIAP
jgi:hypothetical protein